VVEIAQKENRIKVAISKTAQQMIKTKSGKETMAEFMRTQGPQDREL
jgi:hypothetical protein